MARSGLRRVHFIDELRGFLIIFVVLYHLLYDLTVLFPIGIDWMFSPWMNTLRDIFTGTLIVISGISCLYSRSNIRRGLKTLGCGMILTAATWIAIPDQLIIFGILHFFGCAMLLYGLLARPLARIPAAVGAPGVLFPVLLYPGYLLWFRGDPGPAPGPPLFPLWPSMALPIGLCRRRGSFLRLLPHPALDLSFPGRRFPGPWDPGGPGAGRLLPTPLSPPRPDRQAHPFDLYAPPAYFVRGPVWDLLFSPAIERLPIAFDKC